MVRKAKVVHLYGVSRERPVKRRPWGRKDPANGALAANRGTLRVRLALALAGNDAALCRSRFLGLYSFPFVAPPAAGSGLDNSPPFASTFCFKSGADAPDAYRDDVCTEK